MNKSLYARVQQYLATHRQEIPQICADTGLGESWMQKVSYDRIPDPGVKKIEKIYTWMLAKRRRQIEATRRKKSVSSRSLAPRSSNGAISPPAR
jgi:hypothetical protein